MKREIIMIYWNKKEQILKGEIVEIGSHDELIKQNGEYHRLYTAQEQWYREV